MRAPDSTQVVDALEAALGEEGRFFLRWSLELLEVPPGWRDRWPEIPELRVFQTLACQRRIRGLRAGGMRKGESRDRAASELGVDPSALHARVKRSLRYASRRPRN